jgi:hypothetical protein
VHLVFSTELSRHRVQAKSDSLAEEVSEAVLEHLGDRHEHGWGHRGRFSGDVERFRVRSHFDMERLGFLSYLDLGSSGFSLRRGGLRVAASAPFPALSTCADGIAAIA